MTPGDMVAQLYPQALGTHFSCLLRHAWVTVGVFFNTGHHTGRVKYKELNCVGFGALKAKISTYNFGSRR
jgi:hypothetical protein